MELPVFAAAPAEGTDIVAFLVILHNPVGAVAVGDIEIAIGREGHVRGRERAVLLIDAGFPAERLFPETTSPSSVVFTT